MTPCWRHGVAFLYSPSLPPPLSKVFEKLGYVTESIILLEMRPVLASTGGSEEGAQQRRCDGSMTLPQVSVDNSPIRLPVTSTVD